MKAEFDKEIDSLLRQRARRGRTASGVPFAAGAPLAAHLDADEQSAYAENALPAVARARYTEHLADCDDCRRSVTQLALAAGMPAQLEPRETATGQASPRRATWRERLGALFAPGARRYAVPALALLLVSAVSLIVLTRKTQREAAVETSTIARRNTPDAQRPQVAQPEAHHAPQNENLSVTAATPGDRSANVAIDSNTSPAKEEIAVNSQRVETVQPSAGAVTSDAAPPAPVTATGSGAAARAMPEFATPMPTPAPVAEQATVTSQQEARSKSGEPASELEKTERKQRGLEDRQDANRREQMSGSRRNEQTRNTRTADADDAPNRADKRDDNSAATAAPAALPPPAARRTRQHESDRGKDENRPAENAGRVAGAETRTVAGRKFRRQGNSWVDANYNAGQSYTLVRRNSEQFRALVADEPGLRRIADALGGEVTVVWKGRAYRIR